MLNKQELFLCKREAGLQLIVECGLLSWQGPSTQLNDMTEVVAQVVHSVVHRHLMRSTRCYYADTIADQEWELTVALDDDLTAIAQLYFDGKITLAAIFQ